MWGLIVFGSCAIIGLTVLALAIALRPAKTVVSSPPVAPAQSQAEASPEPEARTITLEVFGENGTTQARLITRTAAGDQIQDSNVALPSAKHVEVRQGKWVSVVVSASNAGDGTIGCRIKLDGQVIKEQRSTGKYSHVTCSSSGTV